MLAFRATVSSRSSRLPGGPPGETEISGLNPKRRERILEATGWPALALGSLNLEVDDESVHRLLLCCPVIREPGEDVQYPAAYADIPKLRVGYLYFPGRLAKGDSVVPVLFRRAINPLPRRIEAFSREQLRAALRLSDGDGVMCEVD